MFWKDDRDHQNATVAQMTRSMPFCHELCINGQTRPVKKTKTWRAKRFHSSTINYFFFLFFFNMMTSSNGNICHVTGPLCEESHGSLVNSPHKDQWRGALIFFLICAWINGWVNNREAGDLRRHLARYDVTVMKSRQFPAKVQIM